MYFEMETTYDRETLLAFQQILNQTVRTRRIRLVRVCSFLVAGLSMLYGLIWLITSIQTGVTWIPAISGFLMCAIFLAIGLLYEARMARLSRHLGYNTPVTVRYSFHENGYTTGKGKSAVHTPYRALRILCCRDHYDVLMLDRRRGFVVDHSRFLRGDPGAFRALLEERTGLRFQTPESKRISASHTLC